jgi:cytochrome c553
MKAMSEPRRVAAHVLLPLLGTATLAAFSIACPKEGSTTVPTIDADVTERMEGHFETVSELKNAVIAGDLDTTRELAEVLRDREPSSDPVDWKPHVARLVEASNAAATATELSTAASAAAGLGAACGACHQATGAKPAFDPGQPPMEKDDPASRMQRHQWGVDRMWEGLIGPSEESWRWGAETIDETPGCQDFDPETDQYRAELCARIEALDRSALDARDLEDRRRIYGEFLATCSSCHSQSEAASQPE